MVAHVLYLEDEDSKHHVAADAKAEFSILFLVNVCEYMKFRNMQAFEQCFNPGIRMVT